jgi:hypothetical protein
MLMISKDTLVDYLYRKTEKSALPKTASVSVGLCLIVAYLNQTSSRSNIPRSINQSQKERVNIISIVQLPLVK